MKKRSAQERLDQYLSGAADPVEKKQVEDWLDRQQDTSNAWSELPETSRAALLLKTRNRLQESIVQNQPIVRQLNNGSKRFYRRLAAAVVFISLSTAALFYFKNNQANKTIYVNDIPPGKNKAILTLADGRKVVLDDAVKGKPMEQSGMLITKTADGQLSYKIAPSTNGAPAIGSEAYNTLSTPRGGQYQIELADGSKVWLNSASTLRFPLSFTNLKERKVELTGEGYFEVAHDQQHPFIVTQAGQTVKVLGTIFNASQYPDETGISTTLIKGSVQVNGSGKERILKPGQQSQITPESININTVDTEAAIAWKNGKFKFVNENIREIMQKVARWYDIDVVYEGRMSNINFSGTVSRFSNISKVLDLLESTNTVHFKVEGRRVTVMP